MTNRTVAAALLTSLLLAAGCTTAKQPAPAPHPSPPAQVTQPEAPGAPSPADGFTRMHMLSPNEGWAMAGHRLFALVSNGQTWWEVTPPEVAAMDGQTTPYRMAVDFPNGGKSAWLAVTRLDGESAGALLYHAAYGSMAWEKAAPLPGDSHYLRSVSFRDDLHGWVMVHPDDTMGSNPGALYATADGGKTWALAATTEDGSLPYGAEIRFISSDVGFLSASSASTLPARLFATRDGGCSWTEVTLPAPEGGRLGPGGPPSNPGLLPAAGLYLPDHPTHSAGR